jgi:DNA-binding GntR family transcriptional regulator
VQALCPWCAGRGISIACIAIARNDFAQSREIGAARTIGRRAAGQGTTMNTLRTDSRRSLDRTDEAVYRTLHAAIVDQRLPAGCRLTETALAELLVASRRHVDKALLRLTHERLVVMRRNAGAWVASPSFAEAREIYELRLIVEDAGVRRACVARRAEHMGTLRANLVAETRARRLGEGREAVRLSGEFHVLLARLSGSEEIGRTIEQLVARTSLVTQLYANPDALRCWHHCHADLLRAVEQRREDQAAALMRDHLRALETALRIDRTRSRHGVLERALVLGAG